MSQEQATADQPNPAESLNQESPGQNPDQENPVTEQPTTQVEPEEDPRIARAFAALSRRERDILSRERSLKEREDSLKSVETSDKYISVDDFKKNVSGALKKAGLDVNDFLTLVANDNEPTTDMTIKELRAEIAAMKKEKEEERETKKKSEAEETRNAAIKNIKNQINEHLNGRADDYELILANDGLDLVYNVMEEQYSNGEEVSIDGACKLVEGYLENQIKERWTSSKKLKAMFGAPPPKKEQEGQEKEDYLLDASQKQSPTLSNEALSSAPAVKGNEGLSYQERRRKALEILGQIPE